MWREEVGELSATGHRLEELVERTKFSEKRNDLKHSDVLPQLARLAGPWAAEWRKRPCEDGIIASKSESGSLFTRPGKSW